MILQALADYLLDPGVRSFERFATPIVVGSLTIKSRDDARREIRNMVGKSVYAARRPQDSDSTAIVLTLITSAQEYHLTGEESLRDSYVQIDC